MAVASGAKTVLLSGSLGQLAAGFLTILEMAVYNYRCPHSLVKFGAISINCIVWSLWPVILIELSLGFLSGGHTLQDQTIYCGNSYKHSSRMRFWVSFDDIKILSKKCNCSCKSKSYSSKSYKITSWVNPRCKSVRLAHTDLFWLSVPQKASCESLFLRVNILHKTKWHEWFRPSNNLNSKIKNSEADFGSRIFIALQSNTVSYHTNGKNLIFRCYV